MANASDNDTFAPAFCMPVIAPAPDDYTGNAQDYYNDLAQLTTVTVTQTELLPEQLVLPGPYDPKGLRITITNPDDSFPAASSGSGSAPPPPFGTLFALMGGELTYVSSGSPGGLNPVLPPPFDAAGPVVQVPAPAGSQTSAWGTLVLRLWATDFDKLETALSGQPACATVYYVGVDEGSVTSALDAAVKLLFPATAQSVLQDVVETIVGVPYPSAPDYQTLVNDYLAAFVGGRTTLLVRGGTQMGKAIQTTDPSGGATPIAQIELWFADASDPPVFIMSPPIVTGAPAYDF